MEKKQCEKPYIREEKICKEFLIGYHSGEWAGRIFPILNTSDHYWCHIGEFMQWTFETLVVFLDELESISLCINFSKNTKAELPAGCPCLQAPESLQPVRREQCWKQSVCRLVNELWSPFQEGFYYTPVLP